MSKSHSNQSTQDASLAEVVGLREELRSCHQALELLRAEQEKHRLLIEITNTGFVILDEDGRVKDANQEYVRLTGRKALRDILGRRVVEWTADYDQQRNREEVRKCLELGQVRNLEIDYVRPEGVITPVEINATASRGQNGTTILTICREIQERRRAEEALRNSELRYRTTIDSLNDMVHVVDADLRVLLINKAGLRWLEELGHTTDPLGLTVFELFPFLPERVRDEYNQVFASGQPLISEERTQVGDAERTTETRKIPIQERGEVVRVVTVIRDNTANVRAQERLRHAEKMEALGQLAGGIAHDFNNQLAAILGYAELLARRLQDGELHSFAKAIATSASRSAALTQQLLAFARKGRAQSVAVDIHTLMREVIALLGRTIDKRIVVKENLLAQSAAIEGDPVLLQNALLNLAVNARDAMPEGGELTFSTDIVLRGEEAVQEPGHRPLTQRTPPGKYLQINVSDTGVGMSEETKQRLFEPFYTTKEPGKGTGMGLAAVYGTIANHQGAIRVWSELGRGSTFTIDLPLLRATEVQREETISDRSSGLPARVLLADDEAAVREMAAAALRHAGYDVATCSNGKEALVLYAERWRELDLVILDIAMPELGGAEALQSMLRIHPGVRCLLASGVSGDHQAQRLVEAGARGYIQKPFHLHDLFAAVEAALGDPKPPAL